MLALAAMVVASLVAQESSATARVERQRAGKPPRVVAAERFLAQRGGKPGQAAAGRLRWRANAILPESTASGSASWLPLGPAAVSSQNFGLVTGRISALTLDPSDASGNTLYVGTTGGGVWKSQNAGTSSAASITFKALTDDLSALSGATDASISIGALTVQPGGTGVILAGTGDPNDALDSYYGAGILRSTDGGSTWSLIPSTPTTSSPVYRFSGEGFAGFAWSTVNTNLVVAAVSQAYEGTLVNAVGSGKSSEGLYYSLDSGATWALATISDGAGSNVQGGSAGLALPDGNAATSVVWNPVRNLFVAAVRYHGYYQSSDGMTFTRMSYQPGAGPTAKTGLTTQLCPTYSGSTGSPGCPIFRGALAVNPQTGDTFAWTVANYNGEYNQDEGIWQDVCAASSGSCASATMTFAQQWNTAALESTPPDNKTIANGDYNLTLAAVPSGQGTILLAGANDLWETTCPSPGCTWRNTTNSTVGFCAQVGEYQHSLAWNGSNPQEIFVGNDSGLWRSLDAIGESGPVCGGAGNTDASHFQNLNGSLGSLAEVVSISQTGSTPFTMMAGLGENGTGGVKSTTGVTADWPEIMGGEGGPVAIDPVASTNWYVNNQYGVSIQRCSQTAACTPATSSAGSSWTTVADMNGPDGDGYVMSVLGVSAPFLVDPLEPTQLLIGSCRVWRGPGSGAVWSSSEILDNPASSGPCASNALIRSMAATALPVSAALPKGGEVVYVGMYGSTDLADGIATLPGHVLSVTYNSATGVWSAPEDLTAGTVTNSSGSAGALNYYGMDISSIFIDPHDSSGQTVYVTVAGIPTLLENVQEVYSSTSGGASWTNVTSNLPATPANSLVVDPGDASTVYVATDAGVYATRAMTNGSCSVVNPGCWAPLGSGLPEAPVVQLSAAPATASVSDLVAATYGRGIWMTPLLTATVNNTTASATPASLTFTSQAEGSTSSAQTVTVKNTGAYALTPSFNTASGDFTLNGSVTGGCQSALVASGSSCTIQVTFSPSALGVRTGVLTISGNLTGANLTVSLSGTGAPSGVISLTPASLSFSTAVEVGSSSASLPVTVNNSGSPAIPFTYAVTGPFSVSSGCAGSAVPATGSCPLNVTFTPTQAGAATGTLTLTDAASNSPQSVTLSGTGLAAPTDTLSPASLSFPSTAIGQVSAVEYVTLTNSGGVNLTSISVSVSGAFVIAASPTQAGAPTPCTATLAPGGSCSISVQYQPTAAGAQSGALAVADITRAQAQTVALSGTGLTPPAFAVNPASLTFAAQTVGQASSSQTLTISNSGQASMTGVNFALTPSGSGFSCGTSTCSATTCGATLASGSSCTVQVVFTPTAAGGSTATLALTSPTAGVTPFSVALSGSGQALTGLNVNPAQLAFPIVYPGQSSPAQTVTLSNTGGSAATSLTLTATPPFSLVQNTCTASLAAGASCSTGVVFLPSLNGPYAGTLTIASPSLTASAIVPLSGTGGVPGAVLFQPSLLTFMETGVGLLSSASSVTITNPDSVNSLGSFAVAASAGFKLVNNTCAATLAAGASCTVGVEFAPASAGAQTGNLTVTSSALPTGSFLALQGIGFDFALAPTGSSTQAIANGQIANYKLSIVPLLGSQGAFTFQCGTLPPYSSCTFSPASEGILANTTGNVEVEIATGITAQATARSSPPAAWPLLPLAFGLAFIPLALARRRRALLLMMLLAILAGGVSGCATSGVILGGKVPVSGPGITPAGSYPVLVTATANGVQHQITLTLTVD